MKLVKAFIAVAIVLSAGASSALAGANSGASLVVHVGPHTVKNACTAVPSSCQGVNTVGSVGNFYDVWVCIANFNDSVGVAGVEFGISYNPATSQGIDIFEWARCGDQEFASSGWPQSGTGNIVTWVTNQNCTNTHQALRVAGRFYLGVYSPDRFALTVRPVSGRVKVANCASSEDDLTDNAQNPLGFADFGTGIGYNPCLNIVPTVGTTWTGLKTLYTR